MVRCIAILLAGTSCVLGLTAGAADSTAQSSPQMYTNPYVKQLAAGVAVSPDGPDGGEQNESGEPTKAIEADAPHQPAPGRKSLGSFTFDGLTIGSTTLDEFRAKYRPGNKRETYFDSNKDDTDTTNGVEAFIVTGVPNCDAIQCKFLDGTLYEIRIHYNVDRVNKMGGLVSIVEKISSRFELSPMLAVTTNVKGDDMSIYTWESPENSRRAELRVPPTIAILYVVDTRAESILSDRRAKNANLGF